jgi:hypothetical protein
VLHAIPSLMHEMPPAMCEVPSALSSALPPCAPLDKRRNPPYYETELPSGLPGLRLGRKGRGVQKT